LGTPAITTVGMKENEMKIIGDFIAKVLKNPSDSSLRKKIKQEVKELCSKFKFYD
ncbi:MAG TPA: serine hydroxymethyltransferase, partial [Candidatus Nanoarchaeia archaeon]|nr:serine hydroxymethyltransferase [Candidatus Nanoarchaeia archaeon]